MNLEPFTFVIERLADALIDEIKFLSNDKKPLLESLRKELELAQSYARDVEEEKQEAAISHVLETELQHIMEKVGEIEDFLDTLYEKEEEEQVRRSQQTSNCFPKFVACFSCTSNPIVHSHFVIDKAIQLKEDVRAIRQSSGSHQSNRPRMTKKWKPQAQPHIIYDEHIIGLDKDVNTLAAKLLGKNGDPATILAIVGMGGTGKSTLARKLYNDKEITGHFTSCRAWVCVSQEWDTSQLLRQISLQVGLRLAEDEMSIAQIKLQEFLQRSPDNYLIVLDDVWKIEALQDLLPVLLLEHNSSRSGKVLVTTRKEETVQFHTLGNVHIHEARPLTQEESWDLFSKIVRNKWQGIRSFEEKSEYARLGKEMLKKCNGLPLAIVALAGLLGQKSTIQEWETMKNDVISRIMREKGCFHDYGAVKEMLELSYSDLPYELKPCFIYLGIFKEDSNISVDDLTRLWIAEGFIRTNLSNKSMALEEVARDYLEELVQRCMVQVVSRDYEGKVEYIRIHDLMRELCIGKAKELNFFEISSPSTSSTSMESMTPRAIFYKWESFSAYNPRLRSLIHFERYDKELPRVQLVFEKMKLIRVLHLRSINLGDSIEQIGNLILLRYLRIKDCDEIKQLPNSIKKLRNLLTFTFEGLLEAKDGIPNKMVDSMEQLRHLHISTVLGPSYPLIRILGLAKSKHLQNLNISAGEWLTQELHVVSVGLRALTLRDIHSEAQLEAVYDFVSNPSIHLHELGLSLNTSSGVVLDLDKLKMERYRTLKFLRLAGKIEKQHQPLLFPPNLLKLELVGTEIEEEEDLKGAVAQLVQLSSLILSVNSYMADKLTMVGLPQLQELTLELVPNLKEWGIEEGGLPKLKQLEVCWCYELERIPERIGQIRTLQSFSATGMSKSFCKRLQRQSEKEGSSEGSGGEDFHLIQHIPSISIRSCREGLFSSCI